MEILFNQQLDEQKRKIGELENYIYSIKNKQCQSIGEIKPKPLELTQHITGRPLQKPNRFRSKNLQKQQEERRRYI